MELNNKIKGGIFGLIIGDALGVPYEFNPPVNIPEFNEIEYKPPIGFKSSYPSIKPGTWSDDSAQALCLLDSLLEVGDFDLSNFSDKLLAWFEKGLWAVDNNVFDCGIQTHSALFEYLKGMSPDICGFTNPNGKGNGALMRVLPLAIWHGFNSSDEKLILDAHKQCLITHGHICNQVCCALYCLWAKNLLRGEEVKIAYENAIKILMVFYKEKELLEYLYECELLIKDGNFSGSGFVVDSIRSTKHLLFNYSSYESVVKEAIRLGNDTDTTAAIAGGLAGIYFGFSSIPKRWVEELRDCNKVFEIVNKLIEHIEN